MDTLTLLTKARRAGLTVEVDGPLLHVRSPKRAQALAIALLDRKPEVIAILARDDTEIAWRVAAFRVRLPDHGPIWPPKIRDTAWTDTPGCCSLCGDALPSDPVPRFARCEPCVQALWIALHETREEVS